MSESSVHRAPGVISEVTADRAVLLDATGAELITLNPTGTLVWTAIDGARTPTEIATALHARVVDASIEDVLGDVLDFLGELRAAGLVTDADR